MKPLSADDMFLNETWVDAGALKLDHVNKAHSQNEKA
jgi:hypothetical protein